MCWLMIRNHCQPQTKQSQNVNSNELPYQISLTYLTFTAQWNGLSCVLAVDYDRYVIIKHCNYKSNKRKYLLPESFKCMKM